MNASSCHRGIRRFPAKSRTSSPNQCDTQCLRIDAHPPDVSRTSKSACEVNGRCPRFKSAPAPLSALPFPKAASALFRISGLISDLTAEPPVAARPNAVDRLAHEETKRRFSCRRMPRRPDILHIWVPNICAVSSFQNLSEGRCHRDRDNVEFTAAF